MDLAHYNHVRATFLHIPRHSCRGLIEARRNSLPSGCNARVFRGIRAAASLKRTRSPAYVDRNFGVFRGIRAAASLKRVLPELLDVTA